MILTVPLTLILWAVIENHVAGLQVIVHPHFFEALKVEDVFCCPCIDEDSLDSALVNAFSNHPDFEYNGSDSSLLIEQEIIFEEHDGPMWAHFEVWSGCRLDSPSVCSAE